MTSSTVSLIYVDLHYTPTPKRWYKFGGKRWQGYRWTARNGGNMTPLAVSSEAYSNYDDCVAAIAELFGDNANVYLRQEEHGNVQLRLSPHNQGKVKK